MQHNVLKKYNLYILRTHLQVRARQRLQGDEPIVWTSGDVFKRRGCLEPGVPELQGVEQYQVTLDTTSPNMLDLYTQIQEVCPEFSEKTSFHLYWKNSASTVLPISNYISYLSMVALIATSNVNLYLVAREWSEAWRQDPATTYQTQPEDQVLVNMVAPHQTVFTRTQEYHRHLVDTAARPEHTSTYNPPSRPSQAKDKATKEVKKQNSPKKPKAKK